MLGYVGELQLSQFRLISDICSSLVHRISLGAGEDMEQSLTGGFPSTLFLHSTRMR